MRFERLDLNLLVALDVLIEDQSVSAAANRLGLTQPAVSGILARLREYFCDDLLVPTGRQMMLTAKAEELRLPVREALTLIRTRITTPLAFEPKTAQREFTITASDYAFNILLADVFREAAVIAPGISFELMPADRRAHERLDRGDVDLLLTLSTHLVEGHPRRALWSDEHAVICWSEGQFGASLSPEDFTEAGHVIAYFGSDRFPAFSEVHFAQQGLKRRVEMRLPNFASVPQAIIGTNRLAVMYRLYAEYFAKSLPLTVHPPPFTMPQVTESVQWHTLRSHDAGLKWLIEIIVERAQRFGDALGPPADRH